MSRRGTSKASRRWHCTCPCECSSTVDRGVSPSHCTSCQAGAHKPSPAVREHLREGLEEWARLLRPTGAYVTHYQTDDAADAWAIWHQSRPCPVPR